jgi:lysophospholipase-3
MRTSYGVFWCMLWITMFVYEPVNSTLFQTDHARLSSRNSPIVIIPGDGGNQLEAKLNKPPDNTGCPTQKNWYRLWLDVWSLRGTRLKCWADNIKLVYNATIKQSRNVDGVSTRVPGFGSTSSIDYLDPSWSAWLLADAGNYMKEMVDYFVSLGYERGKSIVAAPYDFRFAPHSQKAYFERLKRLVETSSALNGGKKVTIVSHSMGGLFGLHFLQHQSREWLQTYIHRFIPISCPWIGAVIQMNTYASGYDLGISIVDPKIIREEQRSYETGVYILPHPEYWPTPSQVLVATPYRNYTVRDYDDFFNHIGFPQGIDMFNNVINITRLEHPGVKINNIYSTGVDTPIGLVYDNGFPDEQPVKRIMGDGDGTVTLKSLTYIERLLRPEGGDSQYHISGPNHGQILKNHQVFQYLQSLVTL